MGKRLVKQAVVQKERHTWARPNKAQQKALVDLWRQDNSGKTYLEFRRGVWPAGIAVTVRVSRRGWLGVERDGYVHDKGHELVRSAERDPMIAWETGWGAYDKKR